MNTLLNVENLNVTFRTEDEIVSAVRNVSFSVKKGKTLCIVGESGSGKSVSCHAITGLTPKNGIAIADKIHFDDLEMDNLSEKQLLKIRGKRIAMVFQDPVTSLNPVHTVGNQIAESLSLHRGLTGNKATKEVINLLEMVGIPEPSQRIKEYPHQLSGGMSQRVMIAMALACRPDLLIADEPTTALDVTVQAQILDLMRRLQKEIGMAIILITHDLGVVAEMADDVTVMRFGEVVEQGTVDEIFKNPQHPYTQELLGLISRLDEESPIYSPPLQEFSR